MRQDEKGTMQRKAGNTGVFAGCLYSRSSRGHVCSAFYDYDLDGAGLSHAGGNSWQFWTSSAGGNRTAQD